jgi:AraC family transcriptional regulator of adaptative response / DNA-3-methyladenine glycosylase II
VPRLRLAYRPPFDWATQLEFLAGRCTAGVEQVVDGAYRRTVRLAATGTGGPAVASGWVEVTAHPSRSELTVSLAPSLAPVRREVARRLRALFDLDAEPGPIARHVARDPLLAPSLRRHPGLRVPGAFDGFEAAARVVLGQQVSVAAATTIAGRLAAALGGPIATPFPGLDRLPAAPEAVATAGEDRLAKLGMPGARARTLLALAQVCAAGTVPLHRGADLAGTRAALLALPGVGPWTAEVVAMRTLGDADAFPAGDLGVLRALGVATAREAEVRAERWRPWRSYAVMHLWRLAAEAARAERDARAIASGGGAGARAGGGRRKGAQGGA